MSKRNLAKKFTIGTATVGGILAALLILEWSPLGESIECKLAGTLVRRLGKRYNLQYYHTAWADSHIPDEALDNILAFIQGTMSCPSSVQVTKG